MNASAASTNDWAISSVWVMSSSRRLSDRSATTPAHAPKISTGANWQATSTPMATPLPVRWSTSKVRPIVVSHVPACEISCPKKKSRKLR